jgi:hypothetical protein
MYTHLQKIYYNTVNVIYLLKYTFQYQTLLNANAKIPTAIIPRTIPK